MLESLCMYGLRQNKDVYGLKKISQGAIYIIVFAIKS